MLKTEMFFPNFTKKSLTFSIDDGNIKYDKMLLDIVKPHGILGTFNLCSHLTKTLSAEQYRDFYRGYEISNHVKYHPTAIPDDKKPVFMKELFDPMTSPESCGEEMVLNPTEIKGIYKSRDKAAKTPRPGGFATKADNESYKRFIHESREELENIFGKGSVNGFVWPGEEQHGNKEILEYVKGLTEYYGVRKTGETRDLTGFDMPSDRRAWSYNANDRSLLSVMELYEKYPDDGKLKFFCFGVHSADFETFARWDDLKEFALKYGDRPDTYYYARVGDIFAYEDAAKALSISENTVENPSDITLYLKINGEKTILSPKQKIHVKC